MNEQRYREAERKLWDSVGVMPTDQRLHLDRTGITVRVQEVGLGPVVVLVHGATNSGTSWATLVARLAGFRCVMLDRPGCGLSDPVATPLADVASLGTFGDSLIVDVLDAMELEQADVIGTSFGGYLALRAAAAHPDRIGRIVEFGWPFGATRVPLSIRLGSVPMVGRAFAAMPLNERTVRAMLRRIGLRQALAAGRVSQLAVEWYLALLRDTDTLRNDLRAFPRFPLVGMDDRDLLPAELLARIQTPVSFLWGDEDPFGGAAVAREFVDLLANAELELLPGAGHAVWMDDPDHAAATTREFLGR